MMIVCFSSAAGSSILTATYGIDVKSAEDEVCSLVDDLHGLAQDFYVTVRHHT